MRHKIHNTFSIFEPKRPYSAVTRFSQKQGKIKVNNYIKWLPWRFAVKQKIEKTLKLANKKSVKTIPMNPSWTRILIILLYLRHFFMSQISTMLRPSWPKYQPISEPETPHVITSFQSSRFIIHAYTGEEPLKSTKVSSKNEKIVLYPSTPWTRSENNWPLFLLFWWVFF